MKESNHSILFEARNFAAGGSEIKKVRVEDPSVLNELDDVSQPTIYKELLRIPTGNLELTYVHTLFLKVFLDFLVFFTFLL